MVYPANGLVALVAKGESLALKELAHRVYVQTASRGRDLWNEHPRPPPCESVIQISIHTCSIISARKMDRTCEKRVASRGIVRISICIECIWSIIFSPNKRKTIVGKHYTLRPCLTFGLCLWNGRFPAPIPLPGSSVLLQGKRWLRIQSYANSSKTGMVGPPPLT